MAIWYKEVEASSIGNWTENFLSRFRTATILSINQDDHQRIIIQTRILQLFWLQRSLK
jgi:hypothetical protein